MPTSTRFQRGEPYTNRPEVSIPIQLSLDPETARRLHELAPGRRGRSRYLTRLVWAELARQEERQRLEREARKVLNG
jgi:hypothetical protein